MRLSQLEQDTKRVQPRGKSVWCWSSAQTHFCMLLLMACSTMGSTPTPARPVSTFDLPDCLPRTAMVVLTYLSSPRLPVARLVESRLLWCGAPAYHCSAVGAARPKDRSTRGALWAALHTQRRERVRDCTAPHAGPRQVADSVLSTCTISGGVQYMDGRRRVHELRHHSHCLGDTQRDRGGGLYPYPSP